MKSGKSPFSTGKKISQINILLSVCHKFLSKSKNRFVLESSTRKERREVKIYRTFTPPSSNRQGVLYVESDWEMLSNNYQWNYISCMVICADLSYCCPYRYNLADLFWRGFYISKRRLFCIPFCTPRDFDITKELSGKR